MSHMPGNTDMLNEMPAPQMEPEPEVAEVDIIIVEEVMPAPKKATAKKAAKKSAKKASKKAAKKSSKKAAKKSSKKAAKKTSRKK